MSSKYTEGEPEMFGHIPVRTELLVLRDDDGEPMKLGFSFYEVTGTSTYLIPEGTDVPTNHTEAKALMVRENLVTTKEGLVKGMRLLIQDLLGLNIGYVAIPEDGKPCAHSESGNMLFMLEFVDDRPEPDAPPRWVCIGSANMRALKRLYITK